MIIVEILVLIMVEIVFEGIILGSFKFLKRAYEFVKHKINGKRTNP